MIEILLALLRASREGDWMLHLATIRQMIPWCFAYDKLNYARFLPYYYDMMSRLPIDHPDVHDHFMQGGFSVQIGKINPYGRIPVDQTIEETVNKDTHTWWDERLQPEVWSCHKILHDIRVPKHVSQAAEGHDRSPG